MPRPQYSLVTTTAFVLFSATIVLAQEDDRNPTPDERAQIEQVLQGEGFTSWEEIELDDGVWEVDDAAEADGRKYDLRLDRALAIIEREPDGVVLGARGATGGSGISATLEPVQPTSYVCSDGSSVQALYPTSDLAVLTHEGRMIAMQVAVSGSGARYTGGGWQWWTKGLQDGSLALLEPGEEIAAASGVDCKAE